MKEGVYEVQTLKDGRWMIEQRYQEEDPAIADAQNLFGTKSFKSVKVVKEKFGADSNTFRESVVYQLPSGGEDFQAAASRSAPAQAPASQPRPRPQARAKAKPAKKKAKWGLLDFLKE